VQPGESQTDISEEHIASIFRIEEQAKEWTIMKQQQAEAFIGLDSVMSPSAPPPPQPGISSRLKFPWVSGIWDK
jgi:hypothetical protein